MCIGYPGKSLRVFIHVTIHYYNVESFFLHDILRAIIIRNEIL